MALACLVGFGMGLAGTVELRGQDAAKWRLFTSADGFRESSASAVTIGPRGTIWVRHGAGGEISAYDGYEVRAIAPAGTDNFRVYESRTSQLWTVSAEGLRLYDGGSWTAHSVAEIRQEIQSDPLRQVRQIPLAPAELNRVFFLLSDRLMSYDATARRVSMIRHVNQTGLGRFIEMNEGRDGALLISGARGVIRLPGPVRTTGAGAAWEMREELLVPAELGVENFQRPFEDALGRIVAAVSTRGRDSKRSVAVFERGEWRVFEIEGGNVRQAWPGWDGSVWAFTINAVFRLDLKTGRAVKERIWLGQFKDVARHPDGTFWLATTEGLARYAPYLWAAAPGLDLYDSHIHAIAEQAGAGLWAVGTEGLVRRDEDGRWTVHRWPEWFEAGFDTRDELHWLREGELVIGVGDRPLVFRVRDGAFSLVEHPERRRVRLLGAAEEGGAWMQTTPALGGWPEYAIEHYDGERFRVAMVSRADWPKGELYFARETSDGAMWLGGMDGVVRVKEGKARYFGMEEGYAGGKAYCLLDRGNGRVWIGGANLIQEFDGERWRTVHAGLDRVNGMVRARDGKVWVASNRGLHIFSGTEWLVHDSVNEGLPTVGVSDVIEDAEGRYWAGTTRGLSLHMPEADVSPPRTLPPVVENQRALSIERPVVVGLRAMDKWQHTPPDRLLYAHRLDEGEWSPFTNALTVAFDSLRAGNHRLEVRAMDRNWNRDPGVGVVEFSVFVPWNKEPRIIATAIAGALAVLFFAGLAINRHLRLTRSYAEVEEMVRVRTIELEKANRELLHSQKMKALGTLAAGIAHDFNNILSIIQGSAQIIEEQYADREKVRTRLNRIKTVVSQGTGIVRSMLGLSRMTEKDLARHSLNDVVDETVKLLTDRFGEGMAWRFDPAPGLPQVVLARELLQQMLLNLLLNAAESMGHRGEVVVETGQTRELPGEMPLPPGLCETYQWVRVSDSGCGIPADVLPRIFEPFFTTKALSTRRGTGLGLSMVYELARELEYGIAVSSEAGRGSVFTIYVPAREGMAGGPEAG